MSWKDTDFGVSFGRDICKAIYSKIPENIELWIMRGAVFGVGMIAYLIAIFGSEGLAINMSVYLDNLETEFLPLNCNWITSNLLPKYDEDNNTFVEPYLPNYKIGIMHLAAGIWKDGKDMRVDKSIEIEIETLKANKVLKSLRYIN